MTTATVRTQQELDAALADKTVRVIYIESPADVWLEISSYGSATVRATGSATVAVSVAVADLVPITGGTAKVKAKACRVLHEVDQDGKKVAS